MMTKEWYREGGGRRIRDIEFVFFSRKFHVCLISSVYYLYRGINEKWWDEKGIGIIIRDADNMF